MLKDGKKIKHHHSFRFDDEDFELFTKEQRKTLPSEHEAANDQNQSVKPGNWKEELEKHELQTVKSLMSELKDLGSLCLKSLDTMPAHLVCPRQMWGTKLSGSKE